jgi:hypothetical protein
MPSNPVFCWFDHAGAWRGRNSPELLQEQGYLKGVKVYALPDRDSDDEKAK